MGKYRKVSKSFRSIIILSLILLVLLSIPRFIFNDRLLDVGNGKNYKNRILNLEKHREIDSSFFIGIIQHIFPNKKPPKQSKPILSLEDSNTSFFSNIFKIDFNSPLTFIQAQFPVVTAHHDALIADISDSENEQTEEDWSKEIHLVDIDGNEKPTTADKSVGNKHNTDKTKSENYDGGIDGDICEIGDKDVVDSLNPTFAADLKNIPKPKAVKVKKNKPSILIYHTHGTESYKPITEGNYHSLKKEYTVIGAANVIAEELEKKGYNVIHDTTYHDYPSYSGSYNRSADTVKSILKEHPSIEVILDVHRDGYEKIDTRKDRTKLIANSKVKINGQNVARFQFVIGATSKNRKKVECFAHFVKAVSDSKYPGFSKEILVKQYGSYNQYLSDHSALIELGANSNTIEEARRAGYYFADIIDEALKLLSE